MNNPDGSGFIAGDSDKQPQGFNGVVSPMLTVWRRLWCEFDSMGPPPQSGSEKNFDAGVITQSPDGSSTVTVYVLNNASEPGHLTDETNRYEQGKLYIDGIGTYDVVSNTDYADVYDRVTIQGTPGAAAVNKDFQIYDDDIVKLGSKEPYQMSYRLSGGSLIYTAFADAYIEPIKVPDQYIQTNVPFKRNLASGLSWSSFVSFYKNVPATADLWSVHLLAAWQPDATGAKSDNDPDGPYSLLGLSQDWGTSEQYILRRTEKQKYFEIQEPKKNTLLFTN